MVDLNYFRTTRKIGNCHNVNQLLDFLLFFYFVDGNSAIVLLYVYLVALITSLIMNEVS